MKALGRAVAAALLVLVGHTTAATAAANNTFSGSAFLGDSYAPNNFRLSIKSVDIGISDMAELYAGSRAWMGNYYAGFGLSTMAAVYGLVGYEWRFIPWLGLSAEFDGVMTARGESSGRVYLGVVAGW